MTTLTQAVPGLGRKQVMLRSRPNLQVTPQIQGGRGVYVVKDPVTLRYFQLEGPQHFVLCKMDGRHTLEEIRQEYELEHRPQRLSLEEVESFAHQLWQGGLVDNNGADLELVLARRQEQDRSRFWSRWLNPFYIKLPLANPDRFLGRLQGLGCFLFHPVAFFVGLLLSLLAVFTVLTHWGDFAAELPTYRDFFTGDILLCVTVAFVLVKVLHELGHGLCCKAFGGTVHEMGIVFLFFIPTMYCNVSDSWRLPNKWKRILINAAGIWVELVLASIFVFVWRLSDPGHFLHSFAFYLVLVCSVNTLLFNANPLMRFDGYFILSDWLEIPNLAQKAQRELRSGLTGWFGVPTPADAVPGPRRFLFVYGLASLAYRILVTTGLLWLSYQFMKTHQLPWIGAAIVFIAAGLLLVPPTYRLLGNVAQLGRSPHMKRSRSFIFAGLLTILFVTFACVPFRFSVRATALAQVDPEWQHRVIVPGPGGFLKELYVRDGQSVRRGEVLAVLHNPELECQLRMNDAEQALRRQQQQAFLSQLASFPDLRASADGHEEIGHELRALTDQRTFLKRQKESLILRAPCDGVVLQLPSWETKGKWLEEGEQLLIVGDGSHLRVVLLLDSADRQLVEEKQAVQFLAHGSCQSRTGAVSGVSPAESSVIPPHLAGRVGGDVATRQDPATRGEKPFKQHFLVTTRLDEQDSTLQPGVLGDARITVGSATLWWRLQRFVGSTFRGSL